MESVPLKLFVYETKNGRKPYSEWFNKLRDKKLRGIIQARLYRIRLGN
ncbi:MAG TPA: addiction module protein, partial [Deltaproteobacteria bacterium]|nr:addiction module protein [Deltaproteobacteria bacterium]